MPVRDNKRKTGAPEENMPVRNKKRKTGAPEENVPVRDGGEDSRKNNKRRTGSLYEQRAGEYLKGLGYEILQYNFRCRAGEIDIVAREGEYLVFAEVKYRSGSGAGHPAEAVDPRKQRVISRCAAHYLSQKRLGMETPCRFDVVSVENGQMRLIRNAFPYALSW